MRATLDVHAVKVAGYAVYCCSSCGFKGRGDWYSVEIAGCLPTINELPTPPASYMPVGWASYSGGVYKCPECI